ncbi:MAG: DUF1643 domain-containing protein [Cyclobacteriaceae bacterium]
MDLFDYRTATFSQDRTYRYVLTRIWNPDLSKVMFIGLNPSTANEDIDDPTIRRLINFANTFGFGGLYMLNLFALVTPYPNDLVQCDDPIGNNDEYLRVYKFKADKVVFAWGNFKVNGRDLIVSSMFEEAYCLGVNNNGSPKHPLYLKADTKLVKWNKI